MGLTSFRTFKSCAATVSAILAWARIGIDGDRVTRCQEKHQPRNQKADGGYVPRKASIFDPHTGDNMAVETVLLVGSAQDRDLAMVKPAGFWALACSLHDVARLGACGQVGRRLWA
ncbi:MAG: hypothetical protein AB8B51_19375 [Sedimentitalea sp.]